MELQFEDNEYYLVDENNDTIATTDRILIKEDGYMRKLSVKNCEAVANGYDLDKLAEKEYFDGCDNTDRSSEIYRRIFKEGFQKALEILGDKKFSEEDILKTIELSREGIVVTRISEWETEKEFDYNETQIIQSLQQTEWDVEIVTEDTGLGANVSRKRKLDKDRCLILKRI